MSTIEIRKVTKKFGDFAAVDGVNLTVARGEVVGLLGRERPLGSRADTRHLEPVEAATVSEVAAAKDEILARLVRSAEVQRYSCRGKRHDRPRQHAQARGLVDESRWEFLWVVRPPMFDATISIFPGRPSEWKASASASENLTLLPSLTAFSLFWGSSL